MAVREDPQASHAKYTLREEVQSSYFSKTLISLFLSATPSNSFEPASDGPSNLVGTVLLHEVETSHDDTALIRKVARLTAAPRAPTVMSASDRLRPPGTVAGNPPSRRLTTFVALRWAASSR